MGNIINTIKKARKRGATDSRILDKIIEANPEKAADLKKKKEKKSAKAVLNEIIEKNKTKKQTEKKSKKEKKRKKKKKKKSSGSFLNKFTTSDKLRKLLDAVSFTKNLLVGVDISDHSIEVLLLNKDREITSYGRSILEEGIVQNGEIINQKKLSEILKKTLSETKPEPLEVPEHTRKLKKIKLKKKEHKAIISLPDSKTYIQVFQFENNKNLYEKVKKKVKATIPFDFEELYWDFMELKGKDKNNILCVAASRDIVDMYIYFFKSTNIEPVAFEIEGDSIGRALLPLKTIREEVSIKKKKRKKKRQVIADGKERMIIDMGARTSALSIFNKDAELALSVSLPYAGYYFTKKVAEKLDISIEEAEEKKQKEGFSKDSETGAILEEHGKKIVKEIKQAIVYYENYFGGEVKEILIAGGTSLLPGIGKFLDDNLNPKVKSGNPLRKIENGKILSDKDPILYSNVIGLSLRSLLDKPIEEGINLLPEEVKSQAKEKKKEERFYLAIAITVATLALALFGFVIYYFVYLPTTEPFHSIDTELIEKIKQDKNNNFVIVSRDLEGRAEVYATPDSEEVVGQINPGTRQTALEEIDNWVKIKTTDVEGWVKKDKLERIEFVSPLNEESDQLPDEEVEEEEDNQRSEEATPIKLVKINEDLETEVSLRNQPNEEAEIIGTAEPGEIFEYAGRKGQWVELIYDGSNGWVNEERIIILEEFLEPNQEVEDVIQNLIE